MLRGVNGPATVVLGVDIGTTSAKAVAFDADGRELGRGETGYPLLEPEHGQAVQDPAVVVEGTLAAIRAAAAGARDQRAPIAALSFSGALHSLVGLDGQGRALTPLVTWGDMRATDQAERLRAEHPGL
jgi:gluconokinase